MIKGILKFSIILSLVCSFTAIANTDLSYLPSATKWYQHIDAIGKFYLHKDARGVPVGNFPTWRCNDGSLRNQKLCKGETKLFGMENIFDLDYVRMQSRQTFAYGALFNLTGNHEYLKLHNAGVNWLINHAFLDNGSFTLLFKNGKAVKQNEAAKTAQDLSYALVGIAMNAYLTHSKRSLEVIKKAQKFIYDKYYSKEKDLLLWCFEDSHFDKKEQLELVASLDQLNAYLLLSLRLFDDEDQKHFIKVIENTIRYINKNFYDKDNNRFHGCIDNKKCFNYLTGRHTDYGHTVKAFWMEYLAASMLNDEKLKKFAENGIKTTLNRALASNNIEWFESDTKEQASWWVYAELDQAALSLALAKKRAMSNTLNSFIDTYTDYQYGELKDYLKAHYWRNGFHSSEHALIGLLLSNAIRYEQCTDDKCRFDNQTTLYFAPSDNSTNYTPYLFDGKVEKVQKSFDGKVIKVTYSKLYLPKL